MHRNFQAVAIAVSFFAATYAGAQQSAPSGGNALGRGEHNSFYYGAIHGSQPLNTQAGLGRPVGRYAPVTPVPEPSQWALMLAGLGLVGFMVRRGAKRS